MASSIKRASPLKSGHYSGCVTARRCATNRLRAPSLNIMNSASGVSAEQDSRTTTTALSITASAAASALLAKVTALVATAGVAPSAILTLHQASLKPSEKIIASSSTSQAGLASQVAVAHAPAPALQPASSSLPADWRLVTTAADWIDQNRQAATTGTLLATVFISDKAAAAHAPLLERLRRNYGTGADAPVRFVFVHIDQDYDSRNRACTTAAAQARGPQALTLGRLSHTAAIYGLDVALTSFLPDGVRAFPSLLLTENSPVGAPGSGRAGASGAHWAAATRVSELTQFVSDWAFINRRATAVVPATAAAPARAGAPASAVEPPQVVPAPGSTRVARVRSGSHAGQVPGDLQMLEQQQKRHAREESALVTA